MLPKTLPIKLSLLKFFITPNVKLFLFFQYRTRQTPIVCFKI
jgi:hypothetical protein